MPDKKEHEQLSLFPENSAFGDQRNVVGRVTQLNDKPEQPWIPSPDEVRATEAHLKKEARRKETMTRIGELLRDVRHYLSEDHPDEYVDDIYDAVREASELHTELTSD